MAILDTVTAIASTPEAVAIKEIATFIFNAQQEQRRDATIKKIAGDVAEIKKLLADLKNVIREAIAEDTIFEHNANIELAGLHYTDGNFNKAHDFAEVAAVGLQQENVKLGGCNYFLLAASMDIAALEKLAAGDSSFQVVLKSRASDYRDHALAMVQNVKDSVANRIKIDRKLNNPLPGFKKLFYKIDGVVKSTRVEPTGSSQFETYYANKKLHEIDSLASPLVHALQIAAEKWRVILEGGKPQYGQIFEGCIVAGTPGPSPHARVLGGRRINFANAACIGFFSHVFSLIPKEIFLDGIDHAGDIFDGAKVVGAEARPGAFVLKNGSQDGKIVKVDSGAAITANNSFIQVIAGVEYDALPHYADMHAYAFPD